MTFEEKVKSQFMEEHYACVNGDGYVEVEGFYFEKDLVKVDEYVHALCQKMWDGFDRFNEHILVVPEDED